jgi:hypothetical protein
MPTRPISPPVSRRGPTITAIAEPPVHPDHQLRGRPVPPSEPPLGLLGLISLRRWSLVACVVLGLGVGLGVGHGSPVTYTAQGQLLAGATSVSAAAVPSFAQAGQSLAQTYSRVFAGDLVRKRMTAGGFDARTETASASPVAGSSVILVETTAPTPAAAVRAADTGISALASTVSALLDNSDSITATRATLRTAYEQQAEAESVRNELEKDKVKPTAAAYEKATADLGTAQATVGAARQLLADQVGASVAANGVQPLTSASVTSSTSSQRYQLWGSIGLIGGLVLWLLIALLRSRSLRREPVPARRATA